VFPHLLYKMRC